MTSTLSFHTVELHRATALSFKNIILEQRGQLCELHLTVFKIKLEGDTGPFLPLGMNVKIKATCKLCLPGLIPHDKYNSVRKS